MKKFVIAVVGGALLLVGLVLSADPLGGAEMRISAAGWSQTVEPTLVPSSARGEVCNPKTSPCPPSGGVDSGNVLGTGPAWSEWATETYSGNLRSILDENGCSAWIVPVGDEVGSTASCKKGFTAVTYTLREESGVSRLSSVATVNWARIAMVWVGLFLLLLAVVQIAHRPAKKTHVSANAYKYDKNIDGQKWGPNGPM